MESSGTSIAIDKRKVPDGDGNFLCDFLKRPLRCIDKRKVPDGDGNASSTVIEYLCSLTIDKRKVPDGDGNICESYHTT